MFSAHNFQLAMDLAAEFGIEQRIVIECHAGLLPETVRGIFKHIINPETKISPCPSEMCCDKCVMVAFCQVKDKPRQTSIVPQIVLDDAIRIGREKISQDFGTFL